MDAITKKIYSYRSKVTYATIEEAEAAMKKKLERDRRTGFSYRKYRIEAALNFGAPGLPLVYTIQRDYKED